MNRNLVALVVLFAALFLGGCATVRDGRKVSREEVLVKIDNQTRYTLRGPIHEVGRVFGGYDRTQNIPPKTNVLVWLRPDQMFVFEGWAVAGSDIVGRFAKEFATTDYQLQGPGKRRVVVAPVVIRDVIASGDLPAFAVAVVNICQDTSVAYVRVYNPQNPEEFVDLRGFNSHGFMTIVGGPIRWVQEYYGSDGRLILRAVHRDELDPRRERGTIYHGGKICDFRRLVW